VKKSGGTDPTEDDAIKPTVVKGPFQMPPSSPMPFQMPLFNQNGTPPPGATIVNNYYVYQVFQQPPPQ
jgi:hypothetical protein